MIEQVLTFALEGGRVREESVCLTEVFAQARADLAPTLTQGDAMIVVEDLPTVTGDRDMLYAVALNLLTNAVKFARPDVPARVTVSGVEAGDRARVQVQDNGIGIPPELREDVFVLFTRVDQGVDGNGIGLATTKRVIEAHQGRIAIEPSDSYGTTVVFDLPLG